ncbi:MAG: hypothetical protein HYV36_05135 [Lentisphaerae bacterium]|nr:hypothetical protein [Lentisphaerota bacterium]
MNLIWSIAAGIGVGAGLGVLNVLVLRLGVRRVVASRKRWQAILIVMGSYALRYTLIGAVILGIAWRGESAMALAALAVLLLLTVLLPMMSRNRGCGC